jgi:hypothetical protein
MRKRGKKPWPRFKDPSEFTCHEDVVEATADALDQAASHYAHAMYWHRDFQNLARLDDLDQLEQDRIFNELVVACIVQIMLTFEAPDLRVHDDLKGYYRELRDAMPKAHTRTLGELGVESKYLKDWEKLIAMRFEEYARDRHGVRAAAMDLQSREKELDPEMLSGIQLQVPLTAVAIGCHDHICRGKTDGRDELFKFILNKLARFYVEFRVNMEGGRITRLDRARAATRRFLRRGLRRLRR